MSQDTAKETFFLTAGTISKPACYKTELNKECANSCDVNRMPACYKTELKKKTVPTIVTSNSTPVESKTELNKRNVINAVLSTA